MQLGYRFGGMSDAGVESALRTRAPALGTYTTLFSGTVDMNTTADQNLWVEDQFPFVEYVALLVLATKANGPITNAVGGIYTGANKTGIAVVAASQSWAGLASSTKVLKPGLTTAGQDLITGNMLYFSLTTPMGAPGSAFISIMGLPGG